MTNERARALMKMLWEANALLDQQLDPGTVAAVKRVTEQVHAELRAANTLTSSIGMARRFLRDIERRIT